MRLAAIFIATAFEVRLRNKERSFLKQHERFRMAGMLDELSRWISESVHAPDLVVITCFDEIYELCVRRHVKVIRNEFSHISEGNMIRAGMQALPGHETYLIISASQPRLVRPELFENLCGLYLSQSGKTAVTKYQGRMQLPIVFSIKNTDPVNGMLDKEKGKFVLRSGMKDTVYFEATEEFLGSQDKDHKVRDYLKGISPGLTGEDKIVDVIVIRGGGRIGTGIALSLHEAGWHVLITEKEEPDTLFRGMSFARAVKDTEMTVNGVTAFLVSPGLKQFVKAWRSGVIPVVIDPGFSCSGLFGSNVDAVSLFKEFDDSYVAAPDAGYAETPADDKPDKTYILTAVIDCTPNCSGTAVSVDPGVLTIGLSGNDYGSSGPKYIIETSLGSRYGVLSLNRNIKVLHIDSPDTAEEVMRDQPMKPAELFLSLLSPADGRFREVKRIGDHVKESDLIGQIVSPNGERTDVFAHATGRIAGNKTDNAVCKCGEIICTIDPAAVSPEDCFSQNPLGMLPGLSVKKLIDSEAGQTIPGT